mmetsp:Transcript_57260/g.129744  ORF Transcript_57260/g.129744 Transcript_57260/m.129744 type:complete len:358 (-) Transcript_57260:14-1087(-)
MFLILFALSPCISQGDELIELRGTLRTGKLTKRGDSQAASATLTHFRQGNVSDLRVGALTSSNSTKTSPKPTPQCLTLRPKKDGFGSQYAALISVYGYAVRTNSTFCTRHWSRMAHGLDPTTMFNFVGGHRYYFTREESCPCRTRGAPKKNMHGDMAGHYRSHPEVAMMVREYYNAGRNPELTWFPGKIGEPLQSDQSTQTEQNTTQATPFYLAIHVRRGDAADKNETVHAMNRTGNHSTAPDGRLSTRYMGDEAYITCAIKALEASRGGRIGGCLAAGMCRVHLFSDADPRELRDLAQSINAAVAHAAVGADGESADSASKMSSAAMSLPRKSEMAVQIHGGTEDLMKSFHHMVRA